MSWIESFFKDRWQFVEIDGERSSLGSVLSGVPQGSVLGPLLFLVYINDLPVQIESHCRLFADDAIIYNTTDNIDTLQRDLRTLEAWSAKWQMTFNTSKCIFLQVGKKIAHHPGYFFLGNSLTQVDSYPYLGITLQSNLKWTNQIDKIAAKASQRLALVRRVLKFADLPTKKITYFSIVRPIMEYASQIWDPYLKKQVKQLEKVQNQALRFIFNIKGQVSFTQLRTDTGQK